MRPSAAEMVQHRWLRETPEEMEQKQAQANAQGAGVVSAVGPSMREIHGLPPKPGTTTDGEHSSTGPATLAATKDANETHSNVHDDSGTGTGAGAAPARRTSASGVSVSFVSR